MGMIGKYMKVSLCHRVLLVLFLPVCLCTWLVMSEYCLSFWFLVFLNYGTRF